MKNLFICLILFFTVKISVCGSYAFMKAKFEGNSDNIDFGSTDTSTVMKDDSKLRKYKKDLKTLDTCNKELMQMYKFEGSLNPMGRKNKFCPSSKASCCTEKDITESMNKFQNEDGAFIIKYYQTYLKSMEYLLGWVPQIKRLAEEITTFEQKNDIKAFHDIHKNKRENMINPENIHKRELKEIPYAKLMGKNTIKSKYSLKNLSREYLEQGKNDTEKCKLAALEILQLKLNTQSQVEDMMNTIRTYINKILETRRGFYCTICDSDSQSILKEMWNARDHLMVDETKPFYLGINFCQNLVDYFIPYIKIMFFQVKKYLEFSATLLICQRDLLKNHGQLLKITKQNEKMTFENRPVFEMKNKDFESFLECESLLDKMVIKGCVSLCEMFKMNSPDDFIDGDLEQTKNFVILFSKNKNLFYEPKDNLFIEDLQETEQLLNHRWVRIFNKSIFYSTDNTWNIFNHSTTIIVNSEGVNPIKIAQGNTYMTHSAILFQGFILLLSLIIIN